MKKMYLYRMIAVVMMLALLACNKDGEIEAALAPTITLENESGVYEVKVGREVEISPKVERNDGAVYSWKIQGKIVGTNPSYTFLSKQAGEVFITFRVDTPHGSDEVELRVDVLEKTPPVVSLAVPVEGYLTAVTGRELVLIPAVKHSKDATYLWTLDRKEVGTDSTYRFKESKLGDYTITLTVTNEDGMDRAQSTVRVVQPPLLSVEFETAEMSAPLGRQLAIAPIILHDNDQTIYTWSVDGVNQAGATGQIFTFTPMAMQSYTVAVSATQGERMLTRSVRVHTVAAEGVYFRAATASSKTLLNAVYAFLPAPGQFINDNYTAITMEQACSYAKGEFDKGLFVSLGGFGGYLVVGFDHSISNKVDSYDFSVTGNSFAGSSEPGVVWVMQDENGDGKPNDTWYELKGSETGKANTVTNYAVTYYKPKAAGMSVAWSDNRGQYGYVDYLDAFHRQPSYYPAWVSESSYTLRGTCLGLRNSQDAGSGFWYNGEYDWGYADNFGNDRPTGGGDNSAAGPNTNLFKIENAIRADGSAIALTYVDFVKVQCAVNGKSGWLGEISTEVFGINDINLNK